MARRRSGKHTRRMKRITPRRWLPFLALIAVVAGAVVVQRQAREPEPISVAVEAPATRLPVAAEAGALSTAWFCAGGTATGSGQAELSVVIANADAKGAEADITAIGDNGKQGRTTIQVPANGRTRVVAADLVKADWVGLTIEVLGGRATVEREVTGPHGMDAGPCSTNASAEWFVPSGSTVREASEYLTLYNPFPDATSIDISFATDAGPRSPRALRSYSVEGRSLRVVNVGDTLPARKEIAARIKARTGRIVVDRVQLYSGEGDPLPADAGGAATAAPEGVASTAAIPTTAARWRVPDVAKAAGTRVQLAIYNPGSRLARVDVAVDYERPDRQQETEPVQLDIRAREQTVLDLTALEAIADGAPFSLDIRSLEGVPVVVEQLVFGALPIVDPVVEVPAEADEEAPPVDAPEPVAGFVAVPGSPVAAGTWLLASRGASKAQGASVVVVNPGVRSVRVKVDAIVGGTRSAVSGATVTIPAGDRRVLDLSGASLNPALLITATGPVVVGHRAVDNGGPGLSQSLGTPLPETVSILPD